MDENSKKIRELTEAMHAERDIRIRNRMMAVLGVLKGHSTRIASDFADVDRRTVQLWVARFDEYGIDGLRDAPGRGRASRTRYGLIRKLADRLAGKNMLTPRKLRNWIRGRLDARYSLCSVRRILRFLGFSSKRSAAMPRQPMPTRQGGGRQAPQARYRGQKGADLRSWYKTSPYSSGLGQTEGICGSASGNPWP